MKTVLIWVAATVAVWVSLLAVVSLLVLRPSTRRELAERDVYTQFERATGRQL